MLILFLMGLGASGFNSKWLAHQLDNDRQTLAASTGHDHAPHSGVKGNSERLSDTAHQLLHAVGDFQPLLVDSMLDTFGKSSARMTPMQSRLLPLPPAETEPPFRPPQTISLI